MLITIFGESCTGKSTLADALKERTGAQVYSGKDYLRLAKSEGMAKALFQKQLKEAAAGEGDLIYGYWLRQNFPTSKHGSQPGWPVPCSSLLQPCWSANTAVLMGSPMMSAWTVAWTVWR